MGPTGVGKSSVSISFIAVILQLTWPRQLINHIAGKPAVKVGHDLESCTSSIEHVIVPHPTDSSRRIVLVDTPGFDDTSVPDAEILKQIADWLAGS